MQEEVALFASELIRLKAQVICTKFQPQTILLYAAAGQMTPEDQQMIPQAIQLMKDNPLRNFRIEVDSDSLVQLDEQQNKKDRVEFITAFGGLLREALPVGQSSPELIPMLVEVMKFGISGFKQAKPIEGTLDAALDQLKEKQKQAAANPQPAPPNPEMMKIQATQQLEQAKMQASAQAEQMKMQAEAQALQMQAQIDDQKMRHEMEMKAQEVKSLDDFNRWKTELEAATKIMVARIGANPGLDLPLIEAQQAASEKVSAELGENVKMAIDHMAQMHENMANMHGETMNRIGGVMQTLAAPKRIVRGPDGKAVGVEVAA